jgi:motility quorum-sensing regulator/GCU-specific mRNA interferase toxin
VEKLKPAYDLDGFRREFCVASALRMTWTAKVDANRLGLSLTDVVALVQSIERIHFYKSMTSFADHRVWQDVYNVPWKELMLYVKLTIDQGGRLILSLKEK